MLKLESIHKFTTTHRLVKVSFLVKTGVPRAPGLLPVHMIL